MMRFLNDDDSASDLERAPLPSLSDVLYCPPNPTGSSKMCGNCVFYGSARGQCQLHASQLSITPSSVCGYHLFSLVSRRTVPVLEGFTPLTPMQTGLIAVPSGTSCEGCEFYANSYGEDGGECMAVIDGTGMPAFVEAKGCCARWRMRQEETEELDIIEE